MPASALLLITAVMEALRWPLVMAVMIALISVPLWVWVWVWVWV